MIDTQNIDCFVQALENYLEAKKYRNKCYDDAEYSAGYYCQEYDNAVADAAMDIRKYLIACIREERDELIAKKRNEYFEDSGTFIEFIQNIEVSDTGFFEGWHKFIIDHDLIPSGAHVETLFEQYCEYLATKEVDGNE